MSIGYPVALSHAAALLRFRFLPLQLPLSLQSIKGRFHLSLARRYVKARRRRSLLQAHKVQSKHRLCPTGKRYLVPAASAPHARFVTCAYLRARDSLGGCRGPCGGAAREGGEEEEVLGLGSLEECAVGLFGLILQVFEQLQSHQVATCETPYHGLSSNSSSRRHACTYSLILRLVQTSVHACHHAAHSNQV